MKTILKRANNFLGDKTGFAIRRVGPGSASATAAPAQREPSPRRKSPASGRRALPPARIPAGQAVSSNFFDGYPRFFETSGTSPHPTRLNLRYEAIFGQNRELFDGSRVLDIASHDGRWSFAALQTGAAEVVGVEGRPELVESANSTLAEYGVEAGRYRFIAGDIFDVMANERFDVDVVLCLGFFYHTLRYNELLSHIANCKPRAVIIDSDVLARKEPFVRVRTEPWASQRNAVSDEYTRGAEVLTGRPTPKAIETMVSAYGFDLVHFSDWRALLRDNPTDGTVATYRKGDRVTMTFAARPNL